jgi:uncharacterized protein DUF6703
VATRGTEALLTRLSRLNRTAVFLTALAVVLAGLLLPAPYGGVLLLLVTAALAALLATTWPATPPRMRAVRVLILAVLAILAVTHLT